MNNMVYSGQLSPIFTIHNGGSCVCQQTSMGIESIYLRYPQVFSRLHARQLHANKHTSSKNVFNFSENRFKEDQLNHFAPYSHKHDTDRDNFLPGYQDGYVRDILGCQENHGILGLTNIADSSAEYKHCHQGFRMYSPSNVCNCSPHLTLSIKKNEDILCSESKLYCQPFVSCDKKCRPQDTLSMLRDPGIQETHGNDTVCTACNDHDTVMFKILDTADHCWCNTAAPRYCCKDAVFSSHMEFEPSEKTQNTLHPECDGTRGGDVQVTTTITMLDGDHRCLPPGFADRRAGWLSQMDATVSPFSGAISWMYAPLGSSSGSVSQRAHEESQRACPCVECQPLPLSSLDGRVRSLPPDRTVQQVPRTSDRVTREVIAKRSRPRTQAAGRHVADVNHPYLSDLEDDTDPSRGYPPGVTGVAPESGPRKKRIYLIKRPRCSPRFGSITPLVQKPSETAAGGKGDCPQTIAALTGSAEGRRSSTLVHFAENEDGVVGAVQGGECPEDDILLSCVSTLDRLQNKQKDGSCDSEEFPATATVAAAEAGTAVAVEVANEDLLHKQRAACEGCGVPVSGDVASREVCDAENVTRYQLETERQQLEPPRTLDRDVNDVKAASSEPEGDVQVFGRYVPVCESGEPVPRSNELLPGNESVQERDNLNPKSKSVHKSDELVPGSELVHGSDISVPGNEQQTPGEGELGRTFCEFANTALSFSTPLPRWDLEENYSPALSERSSVWSIPVSPDAVACNGDERDRTGELRREKQDRRSRWNFVEFQKSLPTENTPTHEHCFGDRELSPTLGRTVFTFSDSVNSGGGEANDTRLSCDSLSTVSVRNKSKSTHFCSGKESKSSSDENDDKQAPLLANFSGPTSDLTPEEGEKKTLATMFGSKKGKYNFGMTRSPSTEASDQAEEDANSSLCTLIPRNANSGSSNCARQRGSLNGRPASVGKGRGKVRNKEIYSRFFSDSGAGTNHKNPPRTHRGGSLQGYELVQRSRSKDAQKVGSVDGSCVSKTPTPSCVTSDSVFGACKGPTSSGSRQSFSNSSFSERDTTEQEICLLSQDLETSSSPIGKQRDTYGEATKKKSVTGRLAKKTKKIVRAVKSYDLCSEEGTGVRHFQSWGLPYEPDSESDSTDSTTSDDEYAAGFSCRGDNPPSTDGKRRAPIIQQEPGSRGHRMSSIEEVLHSEPSAETTTAVSTTSPITPQPIVDEIPIELQRKTELSYLAASAREDSQENDLKEQSIETTDAAAHALKPTAGWKQILSNRYAALDHITAEKARSREPKTTTSEATKTDITAPDKGLTARSAKKDRQETSQTLLADAERSAIVKKEEEDHLTPIPAKRASVSVISYTFVEPVERPDAGASVDESGATQESSHPRSREAGSSPLSAGNVSGSSGPNGTHVIAATGPYEMALAQIQREGEDSQLTVVTPLAEPLHESTFTHSSDEVTVTESESETSLSPLAIAFGDVTDSEIYVIPRDALSESSFVLRPQLARFGRAQSAPGKPPCTMRESHTPSAASRSMSLDAARSATLKSASYRIYDVPPRRLPFKFPVESNRPGSVLFQDIARTSATDSSFSSSVFKQQQQPQHLHQPIPDDENPYVNDAVDISQPTIGRSCVGDESQKNAETRRPRLQRTYNTCSLTEGQKTDSQPTSRESSSHPFDIETVVTEDDRDLEGMFEEAVYANSVALNLSLKATQNSRTKLSTASQKDIFIETSAKESGESDHQAQTRGQTAQKGITQTGSRESDQRKKEKEKRESKRPCLGREGGKEPSSEDGGVNRCEESGHGERRMRKPVRTGERQMSDQGTSETQAATVMSLASPDGRNRGVERRDSNKGWSEASQQEADSIDGGETEKESCLNKQDETLKLNPEPRLPVEVTVRSSTSTHTHQYHSDSGEDTQYEDVHVGGQRTTNNPVAPAPVVHVREADAESSPVPETRYVTKQKKYNEYSNVIRIDSNRLKAARAKSSSTAALFTVTNGSGTRSAGSSPLRNAISLEDGLVSGERKKKKKKIRRQSDKDGSPRKYKKPFSFQKLFNLFRKKKKKKGTEKMPEAQEETTGAAGVQTSNKFFNVRKILKIMKKPKAEQTAVVSSTQDINCIRPIGRLLQLNADGTQLVELIRPQDENLGIVLTTGSDEETGIFVSGFTDNSIEKLLAGVLNVGDQIIKVNERFIRATSLDCIHNMIMGQQRIKLLTFPMQGK